jgi:hypothetical protein
MGGGAPSIPQRNLGAELGQTFGAFKKQELPAYQSFVGSEPILAGLSSYYSKYLDPTLQSGGALSREAEGDVYRQTGNLFAETGQLHGNQFIGQELLNREQYRQQRLQQAVNQSMGIESARTGNFMALLAPLLGFSQDVFSSNQNAAAAQAAAAGNKQAGTTSGILGTVGSVAGAVGTAY